MLSKTTIDGNAPAKINLALHIRGRRQDGLHRIESLVAFADVGDTLAVEETDNWSLYVSGQFASDVPAGDTNIVLRAAKMIAGDRRAAILLKKNLPVAAGLGGGSSDAATTIRLLAQKWNLPIPLASQSMQLGADLPVCIESKAARVEGIGECIHEIPPLPTFSMVLVNPRTKLSTADVYRAHDGNVMPQLPPLVQFDSVIDLANWLRFQRNDLEVPAAALCPELDNVLGALRSCRDCILARMSGSGATCFGMFTCQQQAEVAAKQLQREHFAWWVQVAKV